MEHECSSDEDLAWSNASSDNSSSIDEVSNMKSNKFVHESEYVSECNGLEGEKKKKKSKKRKCEVDLSDKDEYQLVKKKVINTDPESGKNKSESEEISQSDSFVNLQVKQENAQGEYNEIMSKKKKKHRKIKEETMNELELLNNTEGSYNTAVDESVVEVITKKKKHRKIKEEYINESELLNNTQESYDTIVNESVAEEIKKKKHKEKIKKESRNESEILDHTEENYNTTVTEHEKNETKKKKKHKKIKEESINASELLDNTKDNFNKTTLELVEDETKKSKKKRKSEHNNEELTEQYSEDAIDRSTSKKGFKRMINIENADDEEECDKIHNDNRCIVTSSTFIENTPKISKMDIDSSINDVSAIMGTVSKKPTRISDRLKFEDDEVVNSIINEHELNTDILSNKEVKTFLNSNPSYIPLKSFTTFDADDDDKWILKCPIEISINDFKDLNLVLDGKSKLKINGQTYDGTIDESDCKVPIVTYSKKKAFIKNLSVLKTITFRKRIPMPHIQDDSIVMSSQNTFIPLPDTKCRHPLFGTNYKKAIKVSKPVLERLAESESQPELEDVNKKKRKKHKKEKNIEKVPKVEHLKEEPEEHEIPEESSVKKRKRKHKIKEESDIKPAKRIKLEQNPEAWESEKAIEENLFNF